MSHFMKTSWFRTLALCFVPLLALACGGDDGDGGDGENKGGPGGAHFQVTVTGPAWPDGKKITLAADDISFFVGNSSTSLLYNGLNVEDAPLISMTMSLNGAEAGTYALDENGNSFTLGGIDNDVSVKEESGSITLETVTDDRVRGTIDVVLRGTQISRKDELYSVSGSFDLRD